MKRARQLRLRSDARRARRNVPEVERRRRWLRRCVIWVVAHFAGASLSLTAQDANFGPLFQKVQLTLSPGERTEVLGPLFYTQDEIIDGDHIRTWAVPSLFSYNIHPAAENENFDFMWKLVSYHRYGEEYRLQILQWLSFAGGGTQSETNVHRLTLFPLYFQQRSAIPEQNYTALIPLFGTLRGRLFRDEVHFVLLPLYVQSRKKDVVTDNYLYPLFHIRHGADGLHGWQFWPLYGHEARPEGSHTNHWGDIVPVAKQEKSFVLWPLFVDSRTGEGTTNEIHAQGSLLAYYRERSPLRESSSYWPLIPFLNVTHTVDREKQFDEWGTPWPFIVHTTGPGRTTRRVWPFYSRSQTSNQVSGWYFWPIYKYNGYTVDERERQRRRVLFFLYSDTTIRDKDTGETRWQRNLWPFYTATKEADGRRRTQAVALLEPYLPYDGAVQRDLSPAWSVWRSERNEKKGASSQSLLWNLYRRDVTPESRKCSLLFGLFQYQSDAQGKRWRLFYVPFRTAGAPAAKAKAT